MNTHQPTNLAAAMGIAARNDLRIRDLADGMGNAFSGRVAQQKFSAVRREHHVNIGARAFGMEYTH